MGARKRQAPVGWYVQVPGVFELALLALELLDALVESVEGARDLDRVGGGGFGARFEGALALEERELDVLLEELEALGGGAGHRRKVRGWPGGGGGAGSRER